MDLFTQILFYTHLLGFAAVAGGLFAQVRSSSHRITGLILNGARWQLISGLILVGISPKDYNLGPVLAKLVIVILILGFCEALRRKQSISPKVYWVIVGLVVLQTAVALFVAKE